MERPSICRNPQLPKKSSISDICDIWFQYFSFKQEEILINRYHGSQLFTFKCGHFSHSTLTHAANSVTDQWPIQDFPHVGRELKRPSRPPPLDPPILTEPSERSNLPYSHAIKFVTLVKQNMKCTLYLDVPY